MNELSPELKRLFRVAREAFSPSAKRVTAAYAALQARVGARAGEASSPSESDASALSGGEASALSTSAALKGTGWGVRSLVGIGVLVTVGTGAAFIASRSVPAPNKRSSAPVGTHTVAPGSKPVSDVPQGPVVLPKASPDISPSPERPAVKEPSAPARGSSATGVSAVPAARRASHARHERQEPSAESSSSDEANDPLSGEIALIRGARAALARRDAAQALALLERHKTLYPLGALRQEQLATRVTALCMLGRHHEARSAARELKRVAPRSPHLARIRASCAGEVDEETTR